MRKILFKNFTPRAKFFVVIGLTIFPCAGVLLAAFITAYMPIFIAMKGIDEVYQDQMIPLHHLQTALLMTEMPPNDYVIHQNKGEIIKYTQLSGIVDKELNAILKLSEIPEWMKGDINEIKRKWRVSHHMGLSLINLVDQQQDDESKISTAMEAFDTQVDNIVVMLDHAHHQLSSDIQNQRNEIEQLMIRGFYLTFSGVILALLSGVTGSLFLTRKHINVEFSAYRDPLTGIHNRRALDERLAREFSHQHNFPSYKFSLIMADIDHFKQVNDKFGHLQGDQTLCKVAHSIKKMLRTNDFIARYGGEEFVIVLADSTSKEAMALAERIRKTVQDLPVENLNGGVLPQVTISLGISYFPVDGKSAAKLLAVADQALYRAKESGRNRVVQNINCGAHSIFADSRG